MGYHHNSRQIFMKFSGQWNLWASTYVLLFFITNWVNQDSPVLNLTFSLFGISIPTGIPLPLFVEVTPVVVLLILMILITALARILIFWTWMSDSNILRESILESSNRLHPLLGKRKRKDVENLERELSINIWELIYLRSYIRILESLTRQKTRAPEHFLMFPIIRTIEELQLPDVDPPFSDIETCILHEFIKRCYTFGILQQLKYKITPNRIHPLRLLAKGIEATDYRSNNAKKLADFLLQLSSAQQDLEPLISEESVRNLVRLSDKTHELALVDDCEELLKKSEEIWRIDWKKQQGAIRLSHSPIIPLYEMYQIDGFSAEFRKIMFQHQDTGSSALVISGYSITDKEGTRFHPTLLRFREEFETVERLKRNHRIMLADLFPNEIDGNMLTLVDMSHTLMLLEGFINRQATINLISDAITNRMKGHESFETHFHQCLLRMNLLPQIFPDNFSMDTLNLGRTISTSGFVGLHGINESVRKEIESFSQQLLEETYDIPITGKPWSRNQPFLLDIPQLTTNIDLWKTMPAMNLSKQGVIGWLATGGGAWIIDSSLPSEYGSSVYPRPIRKWVVFFHHPFREKVFHEILTHQNYHYLWEILHNRSEFQKTYPKSDYPDTEILWTREAFQPSGNHVLLNEQSRNELKNVTDIYDLDTSSDCCIMLGHGTQLLRGPVNTLGMLMAERSDALTPISALVHDFLLRQRVVEKVSLAFSDGEGLVKDGKPTQLCYQINWLRSLTPFESISLTPRFTEHQFSNPRTWINPGFLDLLVKEIKCLYGITKTASWYLDLLKKDEELPFRDYRVQSKSKQESDIKDLQDTYEFLCDYLLGEGSFSRKDVTAVGNDQSYLKWLKKVLRELPLIGKALHSEKVFLSCRDVCNSWLSKFQALAVSLEENKIAAEVEDIIIGSRQ